MPGETREVMLTGKLLPVSAEGIETVEGGVPLQPCWVEMRTEPGCLFIPVFSREEDLRKALSLLGCEFCSVKCITDGLDFLASIPEKSSWGDRIRVALDLTPTPHGTWRWIDVQVVKG